MKAARRRWRKHCQLSPSFQSFAAPPRWLGEVAPSVPAWVGCRGCCPLCTFASSGGGPGHGWRDGSACAGVCHLESEPAHFCEAPPPPHGSVGSVVGRPVLGRVREGGSVFRGNSHTSLELLRQLLHWIWERHKPLPPSYLMEAILPRSLPPRPTSYLPSSSKAPVSPMDPFSFRCMITSPETVSNPCEDRPLAAWAGTLR